MFFTALEVSGSKEAGKLIRRAISEWVRLGHRRLSDSAFGPPTAKGHEGAGARSIEVAVRSRTRGRRPDTPLIGDAWHRSRGNARVAPALSR